jgi:hypothetical protein
MRQVDGDLGFVDEHLGEFITLLELTMQPLDRQHFFESAQASRLGAKDFSHAPDSDFLEEPILAKLLGAIYHSKVDPMLQIVGFEARKPRVAQTA